MNKNFTGSTRTAIDLVCECLMKKQSFIEHLETLNEKYNIQNNVFCCDEHGNAVECPEGYYGELKTFDTLLEASKEFNILTQGIRVHEGKFSVGNLYRKLSDVKEEYIIDCQNKTVV